MIQDIYISRTHLVFPAKGKTETTPAFDELRFSPGEEIPKDLFLARNIKASAYVRSGQVQVRTVDRKVKEGIPKDAELEQLERDIAALDESDEPAGEEE